MKRLVLLVALIWVPFLSIFLFASLGDTSYPHIAFHVFALALLVPGVVVAHRVRLAVTTRTQRLLGGILAVTVPLAVVGNFLELVTAVVRLAQDGWVNQDTSDIWEEGSHVWVANLTVPSMMASMLIALVLVAATAVQGRRRLEPVE